MEMVEKETAPSWIEPVPEGIPAELKSYAHWVVWKALRREDGKWTKVPFSPATGFKASTADSRTWTSFEEAFDVYLGGEYDGIGFVFSSGDPFSGIDFDKVRNARTGEIGPGTRKALRLLGGYSEVSPSGRGIHVILRGGVKAHKSQKIEIYSQRRFFATTGVPV